MGDLTNGLIGCAKSLAIIFEKGENKFIEVVLVQGCCEDGDEM
jgi:hypothetical protein